MKVIEIRALNTDEIEGRLEDTREELFKLRFQYATGQLTNMTRLSTARRTIARLMTVLREWELAAQILAERSAPAGEA